MRSALHRENPILVLRQYSRATADRVAQVYQIAQKPILLVADASLIPVANREDLFRELANRHARCVILYVVRTLSPGKHSFALNDPMDTAEAVQFNRIYSNRTTDVGRRRLLKQITDDPKRTQYRTPFFYGLITFEREFRKIDEYVNAHLKEARDVTLKVVNYVALITKYSQSWLDESIVRILCGYKPDTAVDIDQLFGPAAGLAQRRGRELRLMHPLIAEHVLSYKCAGSKTAWKGRLKDLSINFIKDLADAAGPNSSAVHELLVQLFIRRDAWRTEEHEILPS